MQRSTTLLILILFLASAAIYGQKDSTATKTKRPDNIHSGYYVKLGPVFPYGKYKQVQQFAPEVYNPLKPDSVITFSQAKTGAAMDMGFLIYIGPSFANNYLRLGIDATFLSLWFNPVNQYIKTEGNEANYWYIYGGQKFGFLLTVNPVDRLNIDLSYKISAFVAFNKHLFGTEYANDWGKNLLQSEVSMNIRYSLLIVSFMYNFGKTDFNNFDSTNPTYKVDNATFRVMVGVKI
jgi:hypothetical protein